MPATGDSHRPAGDPVRPRARRRRLLDEDAILAAALDLVDTTGGLTMAALAGRLGATASSIYHHFTGRAAIVEGLRHRVGREVPDVDPDRPWRPALEELLHGYRDAFAAHPRLIPLLTAQEVSNDHALGVYDTLVRLLAAAGCPPEHLLHWTSALDSYVLGAALDAGAPEPAWRSDPERSPHLAAAIAAAPVGPDRAGTTFALGLGALLDGMQGWMERQPHRGSAR